MENENQKEKDQRYIDKMLVPQPPPVPEVELKPLVERINRDLKAAMKLLTPRQAKYFVNAYYQVQDYRIASAAQFREMEKMGEPNDAVTWLFKGLESMETQIKNLLGTWSMGYPIGVWSNSVTGIGPVIAAGLRAHLDIAQAPTAGHIWNFAGYNPKQEWLGKEKGKKLVLDSIEELKKYQPEWDEDKDEDLDFLIQTIATKTYQKPETLKKWSTSDARGETIQYSLDSVIKAVAKRPWNASVKLLAWKIGQSFVKVSNNPNDFYGHLYQQRKAQEIRRNENGELRGEAEKKLQKFRIGKRTDAYKWYSVGKLPPAHLDARARRWTVKLFLAHYQEIAWTLEYGTPPARPYVIEHLGHADKIEPPNKSVVGL